MKLALPFPEALSLATAEKPLPPVLRSLTCVGDTIHAEVDPEALSIRSFAVRLATAAAGMVTVTARFGGYADGVVTFAVTAHARTLPVHKLLPFVLDPINKAVHDSGLPDGMVEIRHGEEGALVLIDVQKAVETKASGVTMQNLQLLDGVIHADALIGAVTLLDRADEAPGQPLPG
jgi:hypothetical protein